MPQNWFGVVNQTTGAKTGGHWSGEGVNEHINYLELMAVFFTLKSLARIYTNTHVRIAIDNTTAVAYVDHMGGRHENLNDLTREIWSWCCTCNIWLSAVHLPGTENVEADLLSRTSHEYS